MPVLLTTFIPYLITIPYLFTPGTLSTTPSLLLKKIVPWDRIKCKEVRESIFNNNRFSVLEDEFFNSDDISSELLVNKFISSACASGEELQITSTNSGRKPYFHISKK
eukprot:jgi/Orpsp1_1/1175339/evm.model.c7180000053448.1